MLFPRPKAELLLSDPFVCAGKLPAFCGGFRVFSPARMLPSFHSVAASMKLYSALTHPASHPPLPGPVSDLTDNRPKHSAVVDVEGSDTPRYLFPYNAAVTIFHYRVSYYKQVTIVILLPIGFAREIPYTSSGTMVHFPQSDIQSIARFCCCFHSRLSHTFGRFF